LPDEFHLWQAELLSQTFRPPHLCKRNRSVVASDLNLDPLNTGWYKRPDWFAVVGVSGYIKDKTALELVSWQEGVRPVVVELPPRHPR